MTKLKLRDYQVDISQKAYSILKQHKIVALNLEVRLWKTFVALEIMKLMWIKKWIFITKKKVIKWISEDYSHYENDYHLDIINYESIHKIKGNDYDICVIDESHTISTYPKPSLRYKRIKEKFGHLDLILLSWTMTPESYSQFFHQFHVSKHSVWKQYTNFYKWCNAWYVKVTQQKVSHWRINNYSKANYDKIMEDIWHLILTYTQKSAGFITSVDEKILHVKMKPQTYNIINLLKKNKVVEWKNWEVILWDTWVKEMRKIQQLCSGTCKFESWNYKILDKSKAEFIKEKFKNNKIAIFYLFKAEYELLKETFWNLLTNDLQEFNTTDKNIALQLVSWREGISLKEADYLIFYNIDFSALSYWQSRDRLTTMDRKNNTVFWIFSEWWIESDIYKTVIKKKDFTVKLFKEWQNNKSKKK